MPGYHTPFIGDIIDAQLNDLGKGKTRISDSIPGSSYTGVVV